MMTYTLDTNCFIDALNSASHSYEAMRKIFSAADSGLVSLKVSLHTLHELESRRDKAWELAKTLPELPHWPVGSWDDQVGSWKQPTGSWADAKRNEVLQRQLETLAKSGTSIRDRGAFIDAMCNEADRFVTSDRQLVKSGPAERINDMFTTKVITPEQAAAELGA